MSDKDTIISHMIELRDRLLRIVIGLLLITLALFPFANEIYQLLATPLMQSLPEGGQMIATEVTTPFFVPLKTVLLTAFILSSPFTLYQIWAFIAPGLYSNERHLVGPLVFTSVLLLLCGVCLLFGISGGLWFSEQYRTRRCGNDDRYQQILRFCDISVHCFWSDI